MRFRTNKAGLCPSRSSVGCSKVVPLLQFFFLCALVVSYVAFILSFITKTRQYSFDPFKPYFYTVKLGFTGIYINFLISAEAVLTSTHNLSFE